MLHDRHNHLPRLSGHWVILAGGMRTSRQFYRQVGLEEGSKSLSDDFRRNLASSLQHACTEVVASIIEDYRKQEGIQTVCLGGGLFQNTLLVANLEKQLGANEIFVPPAPGNSGTALGAGMLAWHQATQNPHRPAVRYAYSGPSCDRNEIKDVLDNCKARYAHQTTVERKLEATLQLLHTGKIVGWFQGAAEFGPRALGNRSLLASPWAAYVKENLNDFVKHRESFRPFAVAVPKERAAEFFETTAAADFMATLATIKPAARHLLEGFLLP